MVTYTLRVLKIIKETEDTCTIVFKQPGLRKIKYLPGQYVTLVVNINNRKYKRPYSLSSASTFEDTINVTVKRLLNGIVSNHLNDVVKEGDILEVIEPMGTFTYDDKKVDKPIYLWGAGSGITPLISIIKAALYSQNQTVKLFYCNKSPEQTIFLSQLEDLKKKYSERFSFDLFYTATKVAGARYGRITEADVLDIMSKASDASQSVHFICGPAGLKNAVKQALQRFGLSDEQILYEDFEHIIDKEELKGIQTQFVELIKTGEKYNVEVVKGKSILEAALDVGIDLAYSCQTGSCTLCKATLLSGEVKKIGDEDMDQPLNPGERLLCCSYPLTNNVKFEI